MKRSAMRSERFSLPLFDSESDSWAGLRNGARRLQSLPIAMTREKEELERIVKIALLGSSGQRRYAINPQPQRKDALGKLR